MQDNKQESLGLNKWRSEDIRMLESKIRYIASLRDIALFLWAIIALLSIVSIPLHIISSKRWTGDVRFDWVIIYLILSIPAILLAYDEFYRRDRGLLLPLDQTRLTEDDKALVNIENNTNRKIFLLQVAIITSLPLVLLSILLVLGELLMSIINF